jgi:F-type H+-transporting ATPase subunit gamma
MSTLKALRNRKKGVQSTKKITSAMKMIAAAKLRLVQVQAQAARPYADGMQYILEKILLSKDNMASFPPLLAGTGRKETHLFVVITSDRGLCGGFNTSIVRFASSHIAKELKDGVKVKIICVGLKGSEQLQKHYKDSIIDTMHAFSKPLFQDALKISKRLLEMFNRQDFDMCSVVYNKFISALNLKPTRFQLIPFEPALEGGKTLQEKSSKEENAVYTFEPEEEKLLEDFLPKNLAVQIFRALLESAASEQGARMTAMDAATRNAEEMLKKLELTYNRTRQAYITKELIEIISGAEAL